MISSRGAGGHRDGERAADHRDARGAGAADRDRRGACRSSIPRPATSRRCSTRCSKRRCGCARRRSAYFVTYRRRALSRGRGARSARELTPSIMRASRRARIRRAALGRIVRGEPVVHVADLLQTMPIGAAIRCAVRWSISAVLARIFRVPLRKDDDAARRHHHLPPGGPPVLRQADRAVAELRGAGGHRDGECAAHHRDARGAGAADRDRRGACRSSIPRPATSRRCSMRCWKRRCGCAMRASAVFWTYDGERFHAVALRGVPPTLARVSATQPASGRRRTMRTVAIAARRALSSISPMLTDDELTDRATRSAARLSTSAGAAPLLAVPLRKDDALLGVIRHLPAGGSAVLRQADRAVAELRRAGGDRDGECAAAR